MAFTYWPIGVGLGVLAVAAALNHQSNRVPNPLTFGMIAAGWAAAGLLVGSGLAPSAGGGLAGSVACTFVALAVMLPAYVMGFMPAGCVKAQMAFGAWLGCALALGPAIAATVIATFVGQLAAAAAATIYHLRQEAQAKDRDEPPHAWQPAQLFPIQTPIALGSLCGIAATFWLGFAG